MVALQEEVGARPCRGVLVSFHDRRHNHASLLLRAGTNQKIVSERLGHSTVAFPLDTYSHVPSTLPEEAAAQFDRAC